MARLVGMACIWIYMHTVIHSGSSVTLTHHLVQVFEVLQPIKKAEYPAIAAEEVAAPAGALALTLTLSTTHFTHTYIHNIFIKPFEISMNVRVYVYVLRTYIAYVHTYTHTHTSLSYDPL
jgi:hypothetical protein